MNLRSPSTISALLALSGLATVGWLSSLSPSQAKPSSTQSAQFTVTSTAQAFKLPAASKPFQPAELKKDANPSPVRAVICEPGQSPKECDDRIPMTNRDYPWSAIGRVYITRANGQLARCSGVLISENIVLTNSHCIVDHKDDGKLAKNIRFRPNLVNGVVPRQEDIADVIAVHYGTDFQGVRVAPNANDWGLLKLNKPLGKTYGYLGWKVLSPNIMVKNPKKFIMVGYSGDFPDPAVAQYKKLGLTAGKGETAGVHQDCSILGEWKEDKEVLVHDCDTTGGSSGGPILGVIDDEYYVVALNAAERTEQDEKGNVVRGIENYAVKMNRLEEWLKKKP